MIRTLRSAVLGLGLLALVGAAAAQTYPNRPVRWIIPYAAGGGSDALARMIVPALSRQIER